MGLWIGIFIVSIAVLITGAKFFTEAAERIGLWLKMSPFMVGVVIVAIGTSLPELIAGLIAASGGSPGIVIGNVIGANVSNIFLILGITALISSKSIQLGQEYIFIDLHFMLGSATLLIIFLFDGVITWKEGIVLIVGFVIYQSYLLGSEKPEKMTLLGNDRSEEGRGKRPIKDIVILIIAGIGIYFGANYTVESISEIALAMGVSKAVVGLTVLSIGTTLPELAVSVSAARKGHPEMAVGNILGSCIFNVFIVTGVTSQVHALSLPEDIHLTSVIFLLVAAVFFYLISQDKKISRWEGMLFLVFYAVFVLKVSEVI